MLTFLNMSKRLLKFISSSTCLLTKRVIIHAQRVQSGSQVRLGRAVGQPHGAAAEGGESNLFRKKIKFKIIASFKLSICFILA